MPYQKPPLGAKLNHGHPLARGLVGCWLFNERSGDKVFDYSGNSNHGAITNVAAQTATSGWNAHQDGGALLTDGSNDYIQLANTALSFGIQDFTIVLSLRTPTANNDKFLIGFRPLSSSTGLVLTTGGYLSPAGAFRVAGISGGDIASTTVIGNDKDYQCIMRRAGTAVNLFVDGVLENIGADNTNYSFVSNRPVFGVNDYNLTGNFLTGSFFYVYIYRRAISNAEISMIRSFPYCMFDYQYPVYWGIGIPPLPSGFTPRIYMIM
jgi:hypothetical protein